MVGTKAGAGLTSRTSPREDVDLTRHQNWDSLLSRGLWDAERVYKSCTTESGAGRMEVSNKIKTGSNRRSIGHT